MEENKIWKFNKQELSFDVTEPGCMHRLLEGLYGLRENLLRFCRDDDADDMLMRHSSILQEFFDIVFGDGMGVTLCGKGLSASAYSLAYLDFLEFIEGQLDVFEACLAAAEEKYNERGRQHA